ncbi:MAG: hypothetical protein JRI66_11300 [Deltaproteobacteria bacterium]|nr:hypothetical protein [Deltaproteobacteria bacterium]
MRLKEAGGQIMLDGEQIVVRAPRRVLTDEVIETLRRHKSEIIAWLKAGGSGVSTSSDTIRPCGDCPWYQNNPWTHYPDLQGWCGWWWDYLLGPHNGQCRDRREGRIADPKSGDIRMTHQKKRFVELHPEMAALTCFECAHFEASATSPNPTQAWGWCRHLGEGRYGVARACDAVQLTGGAKNRRKEKV